mmetsp:Transcript_11487/g.12795  ORF Transcript_11487/g.12795 Transcript_11487/m.12795 type:complete len:410 (-) Transcript_11487:28-1257(-)
MVCKYSRHTWSILFGMIITGSVRSVAVKLAYQSGFRAPLTVTLLYLAGQTLSLLAYVAQKRIVHFLADYNALETISDRHPQTERTDVEEMSAQRIFYGNQETSKGSSHGLSAQSEKRIQWIHFVPWYAKPAIPALFNLLNSALRWTSLIYIDASVAEMLISGLELTLSVVAARIFRFRRIGIARWLGVLLVAFGIIIIEISNRSKHQKGEESDDDEVYCGGKQDAVIGVVLIILQSILSVLQDTAEEIFMQGADFPPTLMLGMEGLYGFCIGLVIYFSVGDQLGRIEDTKSTYEFLRENKEKRWWIIGLPFLFLITGIYNIKATEVTSAMTRNVWKNFRTILVWVLALGIFYVGGNSDYGEAWYIPESFFILIGLIVMSAGIVVYYWYKKEPKDKSTETSFVEQNYQLS